MEVNFVDIPKEKQKIAVEIIKIYEEHYLHMTPEGKDNAVTWANNASEMLIYHDGKTITVEWKDVPHLTY